MGESESRVSDKEEPTTTTTTNNNNNNNNNTGSSCVLGSGVKLQNLQNKMTMMLHHHHNHNRSFDNDDGPTTYMSFTGATSAPLGAAHDGAAVMRPLHISAYSSATTTTFKSPGYYFLFSFQFCFHYLFNASFLVKCSQKRKRESGLISSVVVVSEQVGMEWRLH